LTSPFNFQLRQTGIQQVTYEMLKNAYLDLAGVPSAFISLSKDGEMVPIQIQDQFGTFGPGSFIEFFGEELDPLNPDKNIYTLQVSNGLSSPTPYMYATPGTDACTCGLDAVW
jgi:hypothetical protein